MPFGDLGFTGFWDAAANKITNAPPTASTLVDGRSPVPLLYYVINAGGTPLGGISNWSVGDWAVNFGWGWARLAGGPPVGASLYALLNAALQAGVFPTTPGGANPRLWLNGSGGTGVLEFS